MKNLTAARQDYLRRMELAANRMQTLINDLLTYSRTSITRRAFEKADLNEILNEVKDDFKEMNAEKQVVIQSENLCKVYIIPFQISQLLHNLVVNSLKYAMPGRPLRILVQSKIVLGAESGIDSLSAEKTYCHITISDNGIRFDPQFKDRIFEVFQRLHGKDEYSGTGIGLAIVKKIVDNHNGFIVPNGQLKKGATFIIYIPGA